MAAATGKRRVAGGARLVPYAVVERAASRLGVTLDLSNADLELAGKWKHGWIPLDAVAALVKAKKYHGGAGHGREPKITGALPRTSRTPKGRAGEAVLSRREHSRGRVKGELPTRARRAQHVTPVGSKLEHETPRYVVPKAHEQAAREAVRMRASELRPRAEAGDKIAQAELDRRGMKGWSDEELKAAIDAHGSDTRLGTRAHAELERRGKPARLQAPKRSAATERAQQVAQDRTRRLEAARVGQDEAKVRAVQASHPLGAQVEARQPGIEKVTHGKVVGHDNTGMLQVEYKDRHGKAVVGRYNPSHVKLAAASTAQPAPGGREGGPARKGDLALLSKTSRNSYIDKASDTTESHQLVRVAGTNREGVVTHYRSLGSDPGTRVALSGGKVRTVPRGQLDEAAVEREHTGFYHDQFPTIEDARAALLRHHLTNPREPEAGKGLTMQQRRVRGMSDTALQDEAKYHPDDHAIRAELERRGLRPKAEGRPAEVSAGGNVSRETSVPDRHLQAVPSPAPDANVSRETSDPAGITIEHSGDGTVVHGTSRGDTATNDVLKRNGFKWSSRLGGWYLPRTWGEATRAQRVRAVESALGDRVSVERGSLARSGTAAERATARVERDAELAQQHTERAGKLSAVADQRFGAARQIGDHIPMGQPVLVGHHSEGRHRRDLARIDSNMRKGFEAHTAALDAEHRASEAAARVQLATNPQKLSRRIDRNSAELRKLDRILNGTGKAIHGQDAPHPPGEHRDRLEAMRKDLADSIEHDQQTLAATGAAAHSQASVSAGDYVRIRGSLLQVEKASPKTVTVKSHGLTLKYPYSEIQAHATSAELLTKATDAQLLALTRSAPGTAFAAEAQREIERRQAEARNAGKGS